LLFLHLQIQMPTKEPWF